MLYPTIAAHPLLTAKAAAKVAGSDEHQNLAEALLGLKAPIVTVALDVARVQLAVVMQVNFQIEQGVDALVYSYQSSAHSRQQVAQRDRIINPQAQAILSTIEALETSAGYDTLTSLRTP